MGRGGIRGWVAAAILAIGLAAAPRGVAQEGESVAQPWREMDYGPCLAATLEVAPGNLAYKGLAIRLDPGPGGVAAGRHFVLFDTDTLRFAAGWQGPDFIDWQNIAFDGQHGVHARIIGQLDFQNEDLPGWADRSGSFDDRRLTGRDGRRYGPLPRDWARWIGHYVCDSRVVLAYRVGETTVLEHPSLVSSDSFTGVQRTLNLGPRSATHILQVASLGNTQRAVTTSLNVGTTALPICLISSATEPSAGQPLQFIAVTGDVRELQWQTSNRQLRLALPPGDAPLRIAIVYGTLSQASGGGIDLGPEGLRGESESLLARLLAQLEPPADLAAWTRGGPATWTDEISTSPTSIGSASGPLTAEEIALPVANSYRSWMRPSGFDFFSDGDRAALCTWQGDVWQITGLGGPGPVTWRRIAAGLFQPLGLKIVGDTIYVTCRDQLTRLVDLNGDAQTDFYENFNNDAQVTDHFHEFAMDLQTDSAGNFYYAKAARHALEAIVPQHGTLIRVSPDGRESKVVASGFRAPNGVCVNPDGTFFLTDQEGHWTPKNRINWVRSGRFYGNMFGWHEGREVDDCEPPLCWLHNDFDRSPSQLLWVPEGRWGPLSGGLLHLSYGTGEVHLVLAQRIPGGMQGGVIRLPLDPFPTGIMRGRFHPTDGRLYVCGLFGWSSNQTEPGGFYRVRFDPDRSIDLPTSLRIGPERIELDFTRPLDPESATVPGNYVLTRWNYRRTANYGSDDFRVSNPRRQGRDRLRASSVSLSPDQRTVTLHLPELSPTMQLELRYRIQAADGAAIDHRLPLTIHSVDVTP